MSDTNKKNSNINLKDIDVPKLIELLVENQNSIIKLLLIVGMLVGVGMLFNNMRIKEKDLQAQMSQGQAKIDAIQARDTAVQQLKDFKSSLPQKLTESQFISLVSRMATSNHVTIATLSPAQSKDMGLYDLININFNATSISFKDLILFLRKIEKSKYPLRINSWSGHESENGRIDFSIEISAVIIHP